MDDELIICILGVAGGVVALLILCTICRRCCCCRRTTPGTVFVVPVAQPQNQRRDVDLVRDPPAAPCNTNYYRRNSAYLVPFSALPHDFNYSAPGVVVKEDHVIISDLALIQSLAGPSNLTAVLPPPYSELAPNQLPPEIQKQAPYNPNYGYMV